MLCVKLTGNCLFSAKNIELCSQCYSPFESSQECEFVNDDCASAYDGDRAKCCSKNCLEIYERAMSSLCGLIEKTPTKRPCRLCEILKKSLPEVRLAVLCLVLGKTRKETQVLLDGLQSKCPTAELHDDLRRHHNVEFSQLEEILSLFGKDILIEAERYLCTVLLNGFGLRFNFLDGNSFALALFGPRISFLNHSCGANCHYVFDGRILRIHAARSLKACEELTIPFIAGLEAIPRDERIRQIRDNLHFHCQCDRCTHENYVELDYLLAPRMIQKDIHEKLWNLAETCYGKACSPDELKVAWKFYTKIIDDYVIKTDAYHPFDPISLRRLDRLASLCWIFTGFPFSCKEDRVRASHVTSKALEIVQRLAKSGLIDNTNALEWRYSLFHFAFSLLSDTDCYMRIIKTSRNSPSTMNTCLSESQLMKSDRTTLENLVQSGTKLVTMLQLIFGREDPFRAFRKLGLMDNRLDGISKWLCELLEAMR